MNFSLRHRLRARDPERHEKTMIDFLIDKDQVVGNAC